MQVPLLLFGSSDAEGQEHENDIVIRGGHVRSRLDDEPSRALRA
jgi:hypothetical protein